MYDKNKIKESLTIEQVFELVAELGGEPMMSKDRSYFTSLTICHGGDSHKLYYYSNTKLFKCYTGCPEDSFDIYELIRKVKKVELFQAVRFVINFFNLSNQNSDFDSIQLKLPDWEILNKYEQINSFSDNKKQVEYKIFNKEILKYLPRLHIIPWEKEGITFEVMMDRDICFEPSNQVIVIPHYDIDNNLIGIRGRTIIKEDEKYGKYRPIYLNGVLYNHPLSFNLYNLNKSKNNIRRMKRAIVFEGEKSSLKFASFFGMENDISCAVCGSNLINYQVDLLLSLGVEEIIVAFDKQFQQLNDEEHKQWVKKLKEINKKYSNKSVISFMFDKWNLLGYKDSPIDQGPEVFLELFKRRIIL